MRALARFRNAIWCTDLAYVDKLAKEINGIKYLLVRQDVFDGTVIAKVMKTKICQRNCESLFIHDYKEESTKKRLKMGPNLLERLKSFVVQRGYKFTLL